MNSLYMESNQKIQFMRLLMKQKQLHIKNYMSII